MPDALTLQSAACRPSSGIGTRRRASNSAASSRLGAPCIISIIDEYGITVPLLLLSR